MQKASVADRMSALVLRIADTEVVGFPTGGRSDILAG